METEEKADHMCVCVCVCVCVRAWVFVFSGGREFCELAADLFRFAKAADSPASHRETLGRYGMSFAGLFEMALTTYISSSRSSPCYSA